MNALAASPQFARSRRAAPGSSPGARAVAGRRLPWSRHALVALGAIFTWATTALADNPTRGPNVVRATVQLRNGDRRGSGTVISSVPNETWILTAAHVVAKATDIKVELHRFNFGSRLTGLT